ncbi:MAG: hypothetical protein JWN26_266 [Candidatus Saccharibacteria bacterium]|nr:hypothetical protein [Candidatus Saccharibacteria bacterium]
MTIIHHEPVPTYHVEDLSPEQQDDLNGATRALVAITGRIKILMGDRFKSASVVELHTFEPTEGTEVEESESSERSVEDIQRLEESVELVRQLIAEAGEQGMSVDEFQSAASAAGIDVKNEAVMQALIFGFDEGKFSIRDRDNRIVAESVSSELQEA